MYETLRAAREHIAHNLIGRRMNDETIVSVGCWVTINGEDIWVQATHEDHVEDGDVAFVDDTPTPAIVDENQTSLEL